MAGARDTIEALLKLGGWVVPAGLATVVFSLGLRFGRWHLLLRTLGAHVPLSMNLRAYFAGFALTSTPAKAGETLRSALLIPGGVSVGRSLGAFLGERGADVVGMATLGALAGVWSGHRAPLLETIAVTALAAAIAIAWIVRHESLLARLPLPPKLLAPLREWARCWRVPHALLYVGVSVVAYGLQALVFAAYVEKMGGALGVAACMGFFAEAMLLGAATMIPGGLGPTEAALVMRLIGSGMEYPAATAAVVALRLSTLWLAVGLGVLALLSFAGSRRTDATINGSGG